MSTYGPEEFTLHNGSKVSIRALDASQLEKIAKSVSQFAEEITHTQEADAAFLIDELKKRWELVHLFLGVFENDQLIAYLTLRRPFPDRPWAKHIGEFGFMVLSRYWEQGIGSKLLKVMEDLAKESGINRLEARVRIKNQRATNLFIRNHYHIEGKRRQAALINGNYEDEYFVAKII